MYKQTKMEGVTERHLPKTDDSVVYSTAEEGRGVLTESLHLFSFRFISVLATLTCGMGGSSGELSGACDVGQAKEGLENEL